MKTTSKWLLPLVGLMLTGCDLGGTLNFASPADENGNPIGWPNNPSQNNIPGNNVIAPGEIDPGRITIHRLNRPEYDNTVRDLLGDTTKPAQNFPEDDFGYGFNNIADVLSVSPLHVESYFNAAEMLVDTALDRGAAASTTTRFEAEAVTGSVGADAGDAWNLYSNGEITQVMSFPANGEYVIRARAWQTAAGPENAKMDVTLDGRTLETIDVANTGSNPGVFEVTTTVTAGNHSVAVAFLNDFYDPDVPADRNLLVDWFEVEGPLGVTTGPAATRASIITCDIEGAAAVACAREVITNFGKQAWRRPLETAEVDRLAQFIDVATGEGDSVEVGLRLAMRAILLSPHFLYRVELDADLADATPRPINDYELASRLSYLWSSMPDATLIELADNGQLQDDEVLRAQVTRMLDDPKAIALIDNFAAQWLYVDSVLSTTPDYMLFPTFSPELAQDMREETRRFIKDLIDSNAPAKQLVLADYTYINQNLADHYGVPGISGDAFVKHTWADDSRRGILGQASILTTTSHSTTTSPVLRGKWVLENLWCDAPPAAPPGVPTLEQSTAGSEAKTLRERMEIHATDPTCNACHRVMDPIGFGMENYDAIGAWRDIDNGAPVDASGQLPPDIAFNGPAELAEIVAASPKLPYCVTEKTMTYALGRGIEDWDAPQIDTIIRDTTEGEFRFRDIITAIVLSDAFRMRRGGELQN
ncbi:MAG: DUF1592 domain-containing protein [bacterium]